MLCGAYRGSYENPVFGIGADEVRSELEISESIFAEALDFNIRGKRPLRCLKATAKHFLGQGSQRGITGATGL